MTFVSVGVVDVISRVWLVHPLLRICWRPFYSLDERFVWFRFDRWGLDLTNDFPCSWIFFLLIRYFVLRVRSVFPSIWSISLMRFDLNHAVSDTLSPTRSAGAVVVVRSTGNTRVRSYTSLCETESDLAFAHPCPVITLSIPIYAEQPVIVINQPVLSAATLQQSYARMSGAKKLSAERPPVPGACARSRTYRGDLRMDSGAFHPSQHINYMMCELLRYRENTVAKKRVRPSAEAWAWAETCICRCRVCMLFYILENF